MIKQTLITALFSIISLISLGLSIYNYYHSKTYLENPMINWHSYYMDEFKRLSNNDQTFFNNLKDVNFILDLPEIPITTSSSYK